MWEMMTSAESWSNLAISTNQDQKATKTGNLGNGGENRRQRDSSFL